MKRVLSFNCVSCNETFDKGVELSFDVTKKPKLKSELFNGNKFLHVCPKCNEEFFHIYPFEYIDDDNKVLIKFAGPFDFLNYWEDDKKLIEEEYKDYKIYGVSDFLTFKERIIEAENNYDVVKCDIDKALLKLIIREQISKRKDNNLTVYDVFIDYDGEGDLKFVVDHLDKENEHVYYPMDFDDLYDVADKSEDVAERMKHIDPYNSSIEIAEKVLAMSDEEFKDSITYEYEFLQGYKQNGEPVLTFVQLMNEGKFKKGDFVCVSDFDDNTDVTSLEIVEVDKIFKFKDIQMPCEINDMPVACYKVGGVEIESTMDPDEDLSVNHSTKLKISKYKKINKKELYDDLDNLNVILGAYLTISAKDEQLASMHKNDVISDEEMVNIAPITTLATHSEYVMNYDTNKQIENRYLEIYLEQEDVEDDNMSKFIYKFNDVLKIVLNDPNKYKGICINLGDHKYEVVSINEIIDYMYERILLRPYKVVELIDDLDELEEEYLGEQEKTLIRRANQGKFDLQKFKNDAKLTDEDLDRIFGYGYGRIKQLIKARLLK